MPMRLRSYTLGDVERTFEFTGRTWDMLGRRSVNWMEVEFVLYHSRPASFRHVGENVLFITALDRQNRWMSIMAVEYLDRDDGG